LEFGGIKNPIFQNHAAFGDPHAMPGNPVGLAYIVRKLLFQKHIF